MLGIGLGIWQLGGNRNLVSASGVAAGLYLDTKANSAFVSGLPTALSSILNVVRATTAMDEYSDGSLVSVGTNVARYGGGRGLLIERAATNSIRNSTMVGAAAGAPGTLPTNWTRPGAAFHGIDTQVVGSGVEAGLAYVDIRFYTATTTSTLGNNIGWLSYDATTQITATLGDTWTSSVYVQLIAGSLANLTDIKVNLAEYTAAGAFLSQSTLSIADITSTRQRKSVTRTLVSGTVARVINSILLSYPSGVALDLTLRIAAPQLELGTVPTAFIPTSTVAVTRNSDQIKITGSPFTAGVGAGTSFTWFAEYEAYVSVDTSYLGGVINNGAPTFNDSIYTVLSTSRAASASVVSGGVGTFVNANVPVNAPPTLNRLAMRVAANDAAISHNGAAAITDTSITLPAATMDRIVLGSAPHNIGAQAINGRLTRFAAWPSLLSNADLVALST